MPQVSDGGNRPRRRPWEMTCGLSLFEPSAKSVDYIDLSLSCHFYTEVIIMRVIVELGLVMMPYLVTQVKTGWNPATKGTKDVRLGADFWGTNVPATFAPMANREASWVVSPKARKSSEHQISTCSMELDKGLLPKHMTSGLLMLFNLSGIKIKQDKWKQNANVLALRSLTHRLCRPKPTKWSNLRRVESCGSRAQYETSRLPFNETLFPCALAEE